MKVLEEGLVLIHVKSNRGYVKKAGREYIKTDPVHVLYNKITACTRNLHLFSWINSRIVSMPYTQDACRNGLMVFNIIRNKLTYSDKKEGENERTLFG